MRKHEYSTVVIVGAISFLCGFCVAIISIKIGSVSFIESILLSFSLFWDGFVFKEWQTLIAALIAATPVALTVYSMNRNHKDTIETERKSHDESTLELKKQHKKITEIMEEQHNDLIYRKKKSLKTYLYDGLSELCDYSKECCIYINKSKQNEELPEKNAEYINVLKDYIGYADKPEVDDFPLIIQRYQIINSRLRSYKIKLDEGISKDKNGMFIDIIQFNMMISSIFSYAREREEESDPRTWLERMEGSLYNISKGCDISHDVQGELKVILERRFERRKSEKINNIYL